MQVCVQCWFIGGWEGLDFPKHDFFLCYITISTHSLPSSSEKEKKGTFAQEIKKRYFAEIYANAVNVQWDSSSWVLKK